jgi:alkanesulfonate monooxygenase SsuD/methylene tetrahydromethanopterin reductase-like flavin-dependent oxidoreductase (luciferase family)
MEFWLYLPQMRMTLEQLVARAQAAERAGFRGIAGMDHLAPPGAEGSPMFEAMVTNAWLAARTDTLRV